MLNVSICCNDEHGNHTGRVTRVDFDLYELEIEDTLWPPRQAIPLNVRCGWRCGS